MPLRIPWRHLPIVSLILLAAALSLKTVQSPDLWWNLASGRWMVEHKAWLGHDVFTFTSPGIAWINRTWLSAVVFQLLFGIGGLTAICVATSALVTAIFVAVAVTRHAARYPVAFALLGLLVLSVAQIRFLHRPSLFSDLLAPATILLWLRWREGRSRVAAPILLAAVQVVWTHLHGGFVLGLLIAGAFLVDALIGRAALVAGSTPPPPATGRNAKDGLPTGGPDQSRPWLAPAVVLTIGVAAVLLTPWRDALLASLWGFVVRLAPALLGRSEVAIPETARDAAGQGARNIVVEWLPTFSPLARRTLGPFFSFYALLVGLTVVLVARSLWRRRPRKHRGAAPRRLAEILLLSAFAVLSIVGLRFVGTLALAGFPLLWELVKDEMEKRTAKPHRGKRKTARAGNGIGLWGPVLSTAILLLVTSVVTNGYWRYWRAPTRFGVGVMPNLFPEKLMDWLEKNPVEGRFFNGYEMGSYLGWRYGPIGKVFTDSRVVSDEVYRDYLKVIDSTAAWPEAAAKYGLNGAILDKRDRGGQERLYNKLKTDPGSIVVYEDGRYALIVTNTAGGG